MRPESSSFLEDLRIASPCKANWNQMVGDDRARFCGSCEKTVYDLRNMTRDEAEDLLRAKGEACVRMARRADGTVITSDCPTGARAKATRQRAVAIVGGGLLAASALLWKARADARPANTALTDVADDPTYEVDLRAGQPKILPTAEPTGVRVDEPHEIVMGDIEMVEKPISKPTLPPEPEPVMMMGAVAPEHFDPPTPTK